MQKKTKIIIGVLVIIVILIAVFLYFNLASQPIQQPQAPGQQPSQLPVATPTQNPSTTPTPNQNQNTTLTPTPTPTVNFSIPQKDASKMTLTTPQGDIQVNNLYKNPSATLSNNGVAFKETSDYLMDFYPQDEGFIIAIQNPNIQAARDQAEADFLQILGITKEQACSLKVTLGVPYNVNQQVSGQNYGLSFCSNGKLFNQ